MSAGANGVIGNTEVDTAYDFFAAQDSVELSLLISGPGNATIAAGLISLVESRKDCMVFLSPTKSSVVNNAGNETTSILSFRSGLSSSSYAVLDSGYKYQYDKYNDVYRWVPLNGDIAGVCARTDLERDPWFSPGGLNRGVIKNLIKLAWNPTKTDRDNLYVQGINPVVTFQGEGTILFGDKTLLSRPSVFDRINVRRLFIVLEKTIARAARSTMFEFNDQFTRAQFVNLVEPYLRDVQGRRGITDYRVVCDTTNNTGEIIDRNEFVGDIYIKPARSVNFIQLNFVAVRTGVSFDEIVGRF
jgi:phage tail sheath protein FI